MTSVVGRLRRANEILTTASAFSRHGSAWHGVDSRVRRRVQGPFQGRDRPRPGDERHAGTGNPRRAPRRDSRHRQTGEGRGRRARPRGTRVRGGGAEPATPVLGLQDTGTDRNRVLREPSGASRPTIRAEQKTGHINVPDGTFAPPPRSVMRPGSQRLPAYSSWSIAPENTRFTAGRTTFSDGVRQEFS